MMILLPYANLAASVHVLSPNHLRDFRTETVLMLREMRRNSFGVMTKEPYTSYMCWEGYPGFLIRYLKFINVEWERRSYPKQMLDIETEEQARFWGLHPDFLKDKGRQPCWIGWQAMHDSHQSLLKRMDPKWYAAYKWPSPINLEPIFPPPPPGRGDVIYSPEARLMVVQTDDQFIYGQSIFAEQFKVPLIEYSQGIWRLNPYSLSL